MDRTGNYRDNQPLWLFPQHALKTKNNPNRRLYCQCFWTRQRQAEVKETACMQCSLKLSIELNSDVLKIKKWLTGVYFHFLFNGNAQLWKERKKIANERPAELCVKIHCLSKQTQSVSWQRKKKTKKKAHLAHGIAKTMLLLLVTKNDFVSQSRQLPCGCRMQKICKSLFNRSMFSFLLCQRQLIWWLFAYVYKGNKAM